MLELANPWALILLPLPLLVYFFLPRNKKDSSAVIVPFYTQVNQLNQGAVSSQGLSYLRLIILSLLWLLLVIAAARPQWIGDAQALPTSGRDLLVAVDISNSMSEEDMLINGNRVSRLATVKHVLSEFIQRRKGDRIGLILFGSQAYLQAPLTFDTDSVSQFLQEAQLGFAGRQTAIGDAIGLGVKRLKDRPSSNSHVIVLLTDGENTAGTVEPLQAAQLAEKINAKIYTVGIGADEIIVQGFLGPRRVNPSASLDEKTLTAIADTTGGQYFRARDPKELDNIYQTLDKLEPVEQEDEWLRPSQSLFMWPLAIALALSVLFVIIMYFHPLSSALSRLFNLSKIESKSESKTEDRLRG